MDKQTYPLTQAQRRIWYMDMLYPESSVSNISAMLTVHSDIDVSMMKKATDLLLEASDALRTRISLDDQGEPFQYIEENGSANLEVLDLPDIGSEELKRSIEQWACMPFSILQSHLYEIKLIRNSGKWLYIFKCHHIAADGISINLLGNRLIHFYSQLLKGEQPDIQASVSYTEAIASATEYENSSRYEKDRAYWVEHYNVLPDFLGLKTSELHRLSPAAERQVWQVPSQLRTQIKQFCESHQFNVFTVFLAALYLYLYKLTNNLDLVVGSFYGNRTNKDEKNTIGMFVSTLPLRISVQPDEEVGDFLRKVDKEKAKVLRHQKYPYNVLLQELRTVHKQLNSLISVTMDFQQLKWQRVGEIEYEEEQLFCGSEPHEIGLHLKEHLEPEELFLQTDYRVELFHKEEMGQMVEHLFSLIEQLVQNPALPVSELSLLTQEQQSEQVERLNQTQQDYPADKLLHELFEEQVKATPDRTAIVTYDRHFTYRELNERANRLARGLRESGIGEGTVVALMAERSFDMLVGIYAISKAGAAYLPVDPNQPEQRIHYLLADSGASMLLKQQHLPEPANLTIATFFLEEDQLYEHDASNLNRLGNSRSLAYVIYTSGSTGLPKGVLIEHTSVVNVLLALQKRYPVQADDRYLLKTTFAFDISVTELFGWFLGGGQLVLLPPDAEKDPHEIAKTIKHFNVTHANFVPSVFRVMIDMLDESELQCLRCLKYLFFGGEASSSDLVRLVHQLLPGIRLENCYGPTEATIYATAFSLEPDLDATHVPIGRPLDNYETLVVDNSLRIQPVGVLGELCLAGVGLARGYLNRPELNMEKFVPHPYRPGRLMYRTGDLVRWLPDGNIEYHGRMDHQVKMHGFRIELGEIEAHLLNAEQIKEAIVIAREDHSGGDYLCAYYTLESTDNPVRVHELRAILSRNLPAYMIPRHFCKLEAMPLTSNGKLDRKALPEPLKMEVNAAEFIAPRTEAEAALASVWQEVLGIEQVSVWDHFFHLGGDSIKAMQVASRLRVRNWKLEIKSLFQSPVLVDSAQTMTVERNFVSQSPSEGSLPLTPIQRWFTEQQYTQPHYWNQAVVITSTQRFDEELVLKAWAELFKHHDVLRMIFPANEWGKAGWIRSVDTDISEMMQVRVFDFIGEQVPEDRIKFETEQLQSSLNLQEGPLVTLGLFRTQKDDRLVIVIHHLLVDGVSWRILVDDFREAYDQALKAADIHLTPKTASYQNWSQRLQDLASDSKLRRDVRYWKYVAHIPVKQLPDDGPAGVGLVKDTRSIQNTISKEIVEKLMQDAYRACRADLQDVLLTALGLAISEWTGDDKVCIDLEGHGRDGWQWDEIDVSRTVGWFTSLYPVVLRMEGNGDPGECLAEVKEQLCRVPNKGVGYGVLSYLGSDEEQQRQVSFRKPEICFNFLGEIDQRLYRDWEVSVLIDGSFGPHNTRTHGLDIIAFRIGGKLELRFNYNPGQFREETISRLASSFEDHLARIAVSTTNMKPELTPADYGCQLGRHELRYISERLAEKVPWIEIEAIRTLSPMQEGMLFHSLADGNPSAYYQQLRLSMKGLYDREILETSLGMLIERHDVLRTVFWHENIDRLVQIILVKSSAELEIVEVQLSETANKETLIAAWLQADKKRGFDLAARPLFRTTVLDTGDGHFELIWSFHHLLMDGWSLPILFKEFVALYRAASSHMPAQLLPVRPYRRYIEWLELQDRDDSLDYWQTYLEDYGQMIGLPAKSLSKQSGTYAKREYKVSLPAGLIKQLEELAKRHQTTMHTILQCAWGLLLGKYNLTQDVVFGHVVSGRAPELDEIERMVGLFINTVPVRLGWDRETSFTDMLRKAQQDALAAAAHEHCPLTDMHRRCGLPQGIFNHIMVFENYPLNQGNDGVNGSGWALLEASLEEQTSFDFNIFVMPTNGLHLTFSFNQEVYDEIVVQRAAGHLVRILETVAAQEDMKADEVELVTEAERIQIVEQFNASRLESLPVSEALVHRLFEERVERGPEQTALEYGNFHLSYRELNERANRMAHGLRKRGVGEGKIVGLMAERSIELVVAVIAILKAGAAYLPIDPSYPSERVEYVLNDSGAKLLLAQEGMVTGNVARDVPVMLLEDEVWYTETNDNPRTFLDGASLAYVIYTSGSTGLPKGVMIEHGSAVNVLRVLQNQYPLSESDAFLFKTSFTFDVSVAELFGWFHDGGRLVILPAGAEKEPRDIAEVVSQYRVTHINFVPSMLRVFLSALSERELKGLECLKYVIVAGEAVSSELVQQFHRLLPGVKLENAYGPTEGTVYATTYALLADLNAAHVPIGRPLMNVEAYVMDEGRLQPIGIAGELCLAGAGLARGYLNREELTTEKFVAHPIMSGERMYRTGDLVRWLPDGNLAYLGRMDHQVKIRGYRIELGEIETALLWLNGVSEAVVTSKKDQFGEWYLCAYLVSDRIHTKTDLRKALSEKLPEYMIPSQLVQLERMPLTANGKLDRKALPEPEEHTMATGAHYEAPRNEVEAQLCHTWQEMLGVKQVGIHDGFFDLGGDSIKALQIGSRLQSQGLELSVKDLFQYPTIAQISAFVRQVSRVADQGPVEGEVELTPIQRWFFGQKLSARHHFNQSVMLHRETGFEEEALRSVLRELVEHHDALRMVYSEETSEWKQWNRGLSGLTEEALFELTVLNLQQEAMAEVEALVQGSIDLTTGPLLKAVLFRMKNGDGLLLSIHHLVVDGISWRILLEDFQQGYMQSLERLEIVLPAKSDSYREYAAQMKRYADRGALSDELTYWRTIEQTPVAALPKQEGIGNGSWDDAILIECELGESETEQLLSGVHQAYNTETNDILLTALGLAVSEWAQETKVRIAVEGHGREDITGGLNLTRTVGWFTSLYPVLMELPPDTVEPHVAGQRLAVAIKHVKDTLRRIPNKGVGYGILKYMVSADLEEREWVEALSDICFNYLGRFDQEERIGDISANFTHSARSMISGLNERAHSVDINCMIVGGKLKVYMSYNGRQYTADSMSRFSFRFLDHLKMIVAHCLGKETTEHTVSDFHDQHLSEDELGQILGIVDDIFV